MQLDSTRIAVRERGVLEILDLSLHVLRAYAGPMLVTHLVALIPLMVLNQALLGWMLNEVVFGEVLEWEHIGHLVRYLWTMILLVFIEAPLISIFATAYLGQAVFLEQPRVWKTIVDVLKLTPRLIWCQLIVRGILPAWLLVGFIDRYTEFTLNEVGLVFVALGAAIVRSIRPFMNEIVVLERNPLRAPSGAMTIGRRSTILHGPSIGDLFARWFGSALIGILLVLSVYHTFIFCSGVLLNSWQPGAVMLQLMLPLSMWIVAMYFTVFRFLCYLDLRIRHEGWEVELRLRAEAARLTAKWA